MTVFFIDINGGILKKGLEVLIDYCNNYNLNYFVLKENFFNVHPSWLKLRAFDYVNDDFVLCWDSDLLPHRSTENILSKLDKNKINLVEDSSLTLNSVNDQRVTSYFKYNCGLIGMPKQYKSFFEKIYSENITSDLPSYEQYHVNRSIKDLNIEVNVLPKEWNTLFHLPTEKNSFIQKSKLIHYTNSHIGQEYRKKLIEKHHQKYFNLTDSLL